jgi:hypothetical protein
MKRGLLIAGGTVGGLGAVLAITPPQLGSTNNVASLTGSLGATTTVAATQAPDANSPTPAATKVVASAKPSAAETQVSATPTATKSEVAAPAPTKSAAAVTSGGYSGTVTGASFAARNYGTLSATVTFSNGKITNVSASQSPVSWAQRALSAVVPYVNAGSITVEQIKQYSAAQLPCSTQNSCRSQASFTAEAFWSSVKSAITKAGV